jgi:hypothetical protein
MIDDKYLKILAAIYSISRQNPTRRGVHSRQVEELLSMGYQDLVPAMRYLESSHLITAMWGGSRSALVDLTAMGTDYVERPLDTLRSVEKSLTQANTINVSGDLNAINATITQLNVGSISHSDIQDSLGCFDAIAKQLNAVLPDEIDTALQHDREDLDTKLRASDRVGAAGLLSRLASLATTIKDGAVLIETLPIIYAAVRALFHIP